MLVHSIGAFQALFYGKSSQDIWKECYVVGFELETMCGKGMVTYWQGPYLICKENIYTTRGTPLPGAKNNTSGPLSINEGSTSF